MKGIQKIAVLWTALAVASCSQQQARKPITQTSGSFMKESVARNKKLVSGEEKIIDSIMKSNPQIRYMASKKGYWYHYVTQNTKDTITPKKGDIAYFNYEVRDVNDNVIYSEVELKPQVYHVDKENIMTGLREGIKQMKKNETVTFLFPSHLGYGFHGDNKRIGPNIPLVCTVSLTDFKPEEKTVTE